MLRVQKSRMSRNYLKESKKGQTTKPSSLKELFKKKIWGSKRPTFQNLGEGNRRRSRKRIHEIYKFCCEKNEGGGPQNLLIKKGGGIESSGKVLTQRYGEWGRGTCIDTGNSDQRANSKKDDLCNRGCFRIAAKLTSLSSTGLKYDGVLGNKTKTQAFQFQGGISLKERGCLRCQWGK